MKRVGKRALVVRVGRKEVRQMPPLALCKLLEERTLKHLIVWDDELRQLIR